MSTISFRFLSDSFLLDKEVQDSLFAGFSDEQLIAELSAYREHVLDQLGGLRAAALNDHIGLGAYFGTTLSADTRIDNVLRASLYFDRIVIDDPLFAKIRESTSDHDAFAEFCGYNTTSLDRPAIQKATRLMSLLQPLVAGEVLQLIPASLRHEPPKDIGLSFSASHFAERVPAPLLTWFHDRARVHSMAKMEGGGWSFRQHGELNPCRAIAIRIGDSGHRMVFHLTEIKGVEPYPGRTDRLRVLQSLPEEPPSQEYFDAWVTQSVNQVSGNICERVTADIATADATGTMMVTDSELVAQLLDLHMTEEAGLHEDLANLAMRFELPFIDSLSVQDVMRIRQSEGEAFKDYRVELQRQLRSLRSIESETELTRRIEHVQHEIAEVQVRGIENEVRRLKRDLLRKAVVGVVGVATVIPTQGWSLALLLPTIMSAVKEGRSVGDAVRQNPAYFVWRLRQESRR